MDRRPAERRSFGDPSRAADGEVLRLDLGESVPLSLVGHSPPSLPLCYGASRAPTAPLAPRAGRALPREGGLRLRSMLAGDGFGRLDAPPQEPQGEAQREDRTRGLGAF